MSKPIAFVEGATGGIGSAVVKALEASGHAIVTDYLSARNAVCVVNAAGAFIAGDRAYTATMYADNIEIADKILSVFTPILKNRDSARIITIGSIDCLYPNTNAYAYSIAKASVRTLVHLYRKQYKGSKLNFDLILPGATNTKMRAHKQEDKAALIQPDDIGRLCAMLMACGSNVAFDDIIIYPKSFSYGGL